MIWQAQTGPFAIQKPKVSAFICVTKPKNYFSLDPSLLKHIRGHLTNNQLIVIPNSFIKNYSLPNNTVKIKHIQELARIDKHDLKLASYLNENCLNPSHEKMKAGLAMRLIHNDTAQVH